MLLKKGMNGTQVMELQKALNIKIDGDFGPNTEKAVKEYQKSKGLVSDGIAGAETLKSLGIYGVNIDCGVIEYEVTQLLKRVKGLEDFKDVPKGYWIIGVRNKEDQPDKYDDRFFFMKGEELLLTTTGTTNPGLSIIKGGFKQYNKLGAAVVESDRIYYDVWQYGLHKSIMPALRQTGAKITVFRDGDLDSQSEEIGVKENGHFGINFHTATYKYLNNIIIKLIGGWSSGCQVCNNTKEYMEIINTIKKSGQEKVTYCLLKEF